MKVLLIVPATGYYRSSLSNPLGVLSIATYLKVNGHCARIYDRNIEKSSLSAVLDEFSPDIVGLSVMSSRCLKDAVKLSAQIKKRGLTLLWGGQVPTMDTELCLDDCRDIDYILMGEGELTFLEFVQKLEAGESPDDIKGIAYKKDGKTVITECREFADLAQIPTIDWSLVRPEDYYQKYIHDRMLYLFSAKGCPCNCTFCTNLDYHRCTYRRRPTEMVVDEIERLINEHGLHAVYFTNEVWCARKEDAYEFFDEVKKRKLDFYWGCDSRIGQYNKDDLQAMYDANCRWILFGVETGSHEMMKKINKCISLDAVAETIDNCIKIGITPITSFIVGFPGETEEQLKETAKLALGLKSRLIPVYHFAPISGTAMRDELVKSGEYVPPKTLREYGKLIATDNIVQNFSKVPTRELKVIRCFFHWCAFVSKDSINGGGAFSFAREAISDMFNVITKKGLLFFFVGAFSGAKEFLYVLWNVTMHPRIKKKYGLYLKNKG